ncbi:type I methionyl aminopeptidase [Candidatus Mycoplasma mahonii]|uniref:type I methionyl aminopeptidase n=1 Tax=Candidatus Mycoplasma mahonii TaxID=3004105 RepID=UPI0026E9D090|nr:type I methionyl aminopeptidase [Candidatus Mycoplasma mahonii]WKX02234.1 type I methionyl aminopeptidase [Candidatus Mycoplasma mahonii]
MISIKTKNEIELMRISGKILANTKQEIWDAIKPGVTTNELDKIAFNSIKKQGAKPAFLGYGGFPKTVCISINEELIHGIPSDRKLKEGDVVSIDLGAIWKGYYSDSCFSRGVGKISSQDKKLLEIAKDAFYAGVNAIKPGARVGDVEFAIGKFITKKGYFTPNNYTGHGIGTKLHEDPTIHNTGIKGTGPLLKNGMVICIEPMILQNSNQSYILEDGWTIVSADGSNTSHYEHTILIEDGLPVLLTEGI